MIRARKLAKYFLKIFSNSLPTLIFAAPISSFEIRFGGNENPIAIGLGDQVSAAAEKDR
jgi:hypothetical protein